MQSKHAVYAINRQKDGTIVPFRVGQPVDWNTAQARWDRLDTRRINGRRPVVVANRKRYPVAFFEVRAVDTHGRGLGSLRHGLAHPVPYAKVKVSR